MRIDNCHGFPHRHVYYLRRREFKVVLDKDTNTAFTGAKEYILKNFLTTSKFYSFDPSTTKISP